MRRNSRVMVATTVALSREPQGERPHQARGKCVQAPGCCGPLGPREGLLPQARFILQTLARGRGEARTIEAGRVPRAKAPASHPGGRGGAAVRLVCFAFAPRLRGA